MNSPRNNASSSGTSSRRNRSERSNESQRAGRRSRSRDKTPPIRLRGEASSSAGTREDDRERKRVREELGISSASPMASTENLDDIPDSVRGAPEELRALIRKKQNKESARRSRVRRKELLDTLSESLEAVENRTTELEERVRRLEVAMQGRGRGRGRGRGNENAGSNRNIDRSNQRNVAGSSTTHTGSASNQRRNRNRNDDEMDVDEEVEKLINRCLDQD